MGLLDGDYLKNIMGAAFAPILGAGQLIRVDMVRRPGGTVRPVEASAVPISVQVDRADEAMRQAPGYTATDVKLIVLQAGIAGRAPNTNDVIVAQGQRWKSMGVRSDPARTHWIIHGTREKTEA